MTVHPKLMIGAGIAIAGLGLIGAGAGATFTAQVSATTTISSGGLGLSLNGETGSDLQLDLDGRNLSSHFTPISNDLLLKNTGTLDMASSFLSVTATGCDGGKSAPLAEALHARLTDVTNNDVVYDGTLCSLTRSVSGHDADSRGANSKKGQGFVTPPAHDGVGGQLPQAPAAGAAIRYRLVIQPNDPREGLPPGAQYTSTSVKLVFTGFDY